MDSKFDSIFLTYVTSSVLHSVPLSKKKNKQQLSDILHPQVAF